MKIALWILGIGIGLVFMEGCASDYHHNRNHGYYRNGEERYHHGDRYEHDDREGIDVHIQ